MVQKILISAFTLLLFYACNNGPLISCKPLIYIGNIHLKEGYKGKILVKNMGSAPMIILSTEADCSCVITKVDKKLIPGNDSTFVYFTIQPRIIGYMQRNIFIQTNSVNGSRTMVTIRANIIK